MKIERCMKSTFVVIGKEGSTKDGNRFIPKLWQDANAHFGEIKTLAKKDENGKLCGVWGAMSDFSRSFQCWRNNFSEGLYLAGIECKDNSEALAGRVKWIIPGYEYFYVECENENTFYEMLDHLKHNKFSLVGAVHDFTDPRTGKNYMYFPIRKLDVQER